MRDAESEDAVEVNLLLPAGCWSAGVDVPELMLVAGAKATS